MPFTLIAHRGYSDLAPENTLPAFDLALERGYPQLELDVQLTRDGIPVIIHDDTLDRTTSGAGRLRACTLGEVRTLSAGAWFKAETPEAAAFEAARIPTLAEVLERYAGRARLNLELKSEEQELPEVVAPLLREYGWAVETDTDAVPGLTVTSFHVEQLYRSRRLLPGVPYGWLLGRITEADLALCTHLGLREICPRAETLTRQLVQQATAANIGVRAWAVRNEADLLNAFDAGAGGATVNWPDRAKAALQGRARHE